MYKVINNRFTDSTNSIARTGWMDIRQEANQPFFPNVWKDIYILHFLMFAAFLTRGPFI